MASIMYDNARCHPLSHRLWMINPYLQSKEKKLIRQTCRGFFFDRASKERGQLNDFQKEVATQFNIDPSVNVLCDTVPSKFLRRRNTQLEHFLEEFSYDNNYIRRLTEKVQRHIVKAYKRNGSPYDGSKANFHGLDCCVSHPPTGEEVGVYWAIDVGGTNLRIIRCQLKGNGEVETDMDTTDISTVDTGVPGGLMSAYSPTSQLFSYIAKQAKKMVDRYGEGTDPSNPLKFGLCFSFGINQKEIDSAIVMAAGKDFETGNKTSDPLIGCDVGEKMNIAFKELFMNARCVGVLNDTTGTMFAAGYENAQNSGLPPVYMGMIVGTGFNVCVSHSLAEEYGYKGTTVNLEAGFLRCRDHDVDTIYNHCSHFSYKMPYLAEKRVSGKWLGDILRYSMVWLLRSEATDEMRQRDTMEAYDMAEIFNASAESNDVNNTIIKVMKRCFNWTPPSQFHIDLVEKVVNAIFERSAKVVASVVAGVAISTNLLEQGKGGLTVGADGSVYCKNLPYQKLVRSYLEVILGSRHELIKIVQTKDGSGKGAVMLACVVDRENKKLKGSGGGDTSRGKQSKKSACC